MFVKTDQIIHFRCILLYVNCTSRRFLHTYRECVLIGQIEIKDDSKIMSRFQLWVTYEYGGSIKKKREETDWLRIMMSSLWDMWTWRT